ncbi:hypothetical protein PBI_TERROR_45 [Mycobacterium phage Terror]|uniref:Uncharacterized protein n=1 Tax=Mycobacterium phage Taheera TaxID=1897549 RepID=A0A1D8EVW1_9CAUD|nr:replication initiation protein [Mycobacterium phage Taheera]AOT25156.1 hypothetical protein PBI_TAHEERA_45 [Mycobacterium phage Taheera]AOT25214.1 hypothetical protein PBI_TERROR_45 [Mycobacterium phage Terror]
MGLPWVRLDTQFPSNPKILALVEEKKFRAAFVWTASLAYAGAHGTDGFLPSAVLPFLHATKSDAKTLVDVGLWLECIGGWEINSWAEFQPSNAETQERKKRAKEAAQKAAHARWHGGTGLDRG